MDKTVTLEGRGIIPCMQHVGEAHTYQGPPMAAPELLSLLSRAMGRHAQLGLAIDNLRQILIAEGLLGQEWPAAPQGLIEEMRQALDLAQSVIPGVHREALAQVTRALERADSYQDALSPRGQA